MKVQMKATETKRGFLIKRPAFSVFTKVEFSAEERAILDTRKLWKATVVELRPPGLEDAPIILDARAFEEGVTYSHLDSPAEVKDYENYVKDQLKQLKDFIQENESIDGEEQTFEL